MAVYRMSLKARVGEGARLSGARAEEAEAGAGAQHVVDELRRPVLRSAREVREA